MRKLLRETKLYNRTVAIVLILAFVAAVIPDMTVSASTQNIAKGCTAEAECPAWAQGSMGAEKLVDGDRTSSNYTSSGCEENEQKDIYLTFTEAYKVNEVRIYPYMYQGNADGFPKDFTVSLWNGIEWKEIASETNYTATTSEVVYQFEEGDFRALRLCATKQGISHEGGYALRLAEVDVYGSAFVAAVSNPFANVSNIARSDNGTTMEADCPTWSSPSKLNDGDTTSASVFSTSGYESSNTEKTIYLKFNRTYAVKEIKFYPYVNNGTVDSFPKDFTVSLWNGKTWVKVVEKTGCSPSAGDILSLSILPRECTALKVDITKLGEQTAETVNRYAVRMSEIEVYGVASAMSMEKWPGEKANVALTATAEAQCPAWAQGSMSANKLIDGDTSSNSKYTSSGCGEYEEKEIYLTFDQTYTVNEVQFYPYVNADSGKPDSFPKDFTVSGWNGKKWVEVASMTNYSATTSPLSLSFASGDYRAIRIRTTRNGEQTGNGESGYALRMSEIKVFGCTSAVQISSPAVWIDSCNLARTATAKGESIQIVVDLGAEKMIDGDRTGSFFSSPSSTSADTSKEVSLTLKAASKVNEIRLYPVVKDGKYFGAFPKDFTVSIFDGAEWITVAQETDYRASAKPYIIDLPQGKYGVQGVMVSATKLDAEYQGASTYYLQLAEIEVYGVETELLRVEDYKGNRAESDWKAPKKEGKVFAGWYADATFKTPYYQTDGLAYAKFVNEEVLSVKKQLSTGTAASSPSTNIRFVTSIDVLDYRCVGFEVNAAGKKFNLKETYAYSSIKTDGVISTLKPENAFSEESVYFVLHSITGIPNSVFGETFTVMPYWYTADGTKVYGISDYFTIKQKTVQDSSKLTAFEAGEVTRSSGLFKDVYDGCMAYHDTLTADDLLYHWRSSYGLDTEDGRDLGWTSGTTAPECCVAQLISAKARRYAITQKEEDLRTVQEIVDGYRDVVEKTETHPLMYNQYFFEKALRAFIDIYEYCGLEEGWQLAKSLVEWGLTQDTYANPTKLLGDKSNEWYTMSEALYLFAELARNKGESETNVKRYTRFADLYAYTEFWDIFYKDENIFDYSPKASGSYFDYFHAYSHLNSFNSALEIYRQTGDTYYLDAAKKFYRWVCQDEKLATGGYGMEWEYLLPVSRQIGWLRTSEERTCETQCTSYAVVNMDNRLLIVTGDGAYGNWTEEAFYNMTIASLETKDGKAMYYSKYSPLGGNKYLRDDWPWACCAGTRPLVVMEYLKSIYFHDTKNLYVNLYTNSSVNFTNANGNQITLSQSSSFPEEDTIMFTVDASASEDFSINFRKPDWIAGNVSMKVNGTAVSYTEKDGWIVVNRTWTSGDKVALTLPMNLYYSKLEESPNDGVYAVKYGPVALACKGDATSISNLKTVLPITSDVNSLLTKGTGLTFTAKANANIVMKPYYSYGDMERYMLYISTK